MMPRRNHPARGPRKTVHGRRTRAVYLRDSCGKLRFPTYRIAARLAGRARAEYRIDDDGHYIYRCRWNGGWHLTSRSQSEFDARRAFYRNQAEVTAA